MGLTCSSRGCSSTRNSLSAEIYRSSCMPPFCLRFPTLRSPSTCSLFRFCSGITIALSLVLNKLRQAGNGKGHVDSEILPIIQYIHMLIHDFIIIIRIFIYYFLLYLLYFIYILCYLFFIKFLYFSHFFILQYFIYIFIESPTSLGLFLRSLL